MTIDLGTSWEQFRGNLTEETFGPFYERTRGVVYSIAYRILHDEEDARDTLQAAYCRLIELARSNPAPRSAKEIEAAIVRFAVREAENLRKRRGRRQGRETLVERLPDAPDFLPSARHEAARRETASKLEGILAALPDQYRVPIILHYYHDMTHGEIAAALDRPINTISSQINRGLKKLDPLTRRAGLGEALAALGGMAGATALLSPPASLSAAVVYGTAQTVFSGATAAVAGAALLKGTLSSAILSTKGGLFASGLTAGLLIFVAVAFMRQPEKAAEENTNAASTPSAEIAKASGPADDEPVLPRENIEIAQAAALKNTTAKSEPAKRSPAADSSLFAASNQSKIPPRIGVLLAASSAEDTSPPDATEPLASYVRDYYAQPFVISSLKGLGFDIYAIIEPGTEKNAALSEVLKRVKLEDRVIIGTDKETLSKLDGIGSGLNSKVQPEVVDAIIEAVRGGVGFLTLGGFGSRIPGNTDKLRDFLGINQAPENFRVYQQKFQLVVVAPEEMLIGNFDPSYPKLDMEMICGYTGVVDGVPLLALPEGMDQDFCASYVRTFGKGRVAAIQMFLNTNNINMAGIRMAAQYTANWVCKRAVDADWRGVPPGPPIVEAISDSTEQAAFQAPIKAGFIVSRLTERRPNFDYEKASAVVGVDPYVNALGTVVTGAEILGCVPYVIADAHELDNPETRVLLAQTAMADHIIELNQADEIKKMDIFVSYFSPFLSGEVVEAIHGAVRGGAGFMALGEIGTRDKEDEPALEALIGLAASRERLKVFKGELAGTWLEHPDFKTLHVPGSAVKFWHIAGFEGEPDGGMPLFKLNSGGAVSPGFTRRVGYGRVLVLPAYAVYSGAFFDMRYFLNEERGFWSEAYRWVAGRALDQPAK